MKMTKLFKPILALSLLVVMMSGCKKDEFTTTGTLKVSFAKHPSDLSVIITPAENSEVAISKWLDPYKDGTLVRELNIGNYVLISSSTSTYISKVGFQIRAGKTTEINFDQNFNESVQ